MNEINGGSRSDFHEAEYHTHSTYKSCNERLPSVKKLERKNYRRRGNQPQGQRVKNITA
jgi:hypothetical protein